jgi:hypothetical protein
MKAARHNKPRRGEDGLVADTMPEPWRSFATVAFHAGWQTPPRLYTTSGAPGEPITIGIRCSEEAAKRIEHRLTRMPHQNVREMSRRRRQLGIDKFAFMANIKDREHAAIDAALRHQAIAAEFAVDRTEQRAREHFKTLLKTATCDSSASA